MANADIINLIKDVYEVGRTSPSRCEQLSKLQKSEEAWTICSEILKCSTQQNLALPVVTFAALTLKRKIKKDLNALNRENHEPLKQLIIESLVIYAGNKPIRTQLCLALVYLVVQSDKWNDPIVTITSCIPDGDEKAMIVLEYFTILADELTTLRDIKIKSIRRDILRKQLHDLAPDVNQFLLSLLCQRQYDNNFICNIINCYTIWIDGQLIDERLLMTPNCDECQLLSFLLKYILEAEKCDEELHDSCTECLCSLLQTCGDNLGINRNILVKANAIIVNSFPQMLGTVNQWTQEITKPIFNLLKVLVSLGYSLQNVYRLNIPDSELNDPRVLQCLLEYTKCKHYDVVDIMLSFWDEFTDCTSSEIVKQMSRFSDVFDILIDRLLELVHVKSDTTVVPTHSTNSDLFRTRRNAQNIMHSIVCILGVERCSIRLYDELTTDDWTIAEAAICLMWACGLRLSELEKEKPVESMEIRYVLIEFIIPMQPNRCHPVLIASSIDLINSLSQWLSNRLDILTTSMEFLFRFLPHTSQSSCAKAILSMCTANPYAVVDSLPTFIDATKSALTMKEVAISAVTISCLIKATSLLLVYAWRQSKIFDIDSLLLSFSENINMGIVKCSQSVGIVSRHGSGKRSVNTELITRLERLCSFFRTINQAKSKEHDDKKLIRVILKSFHLHLWVQLLELIQYDNVDVVESACNIFRYVIRCSGTDFEPLAPSLIKSIVTAFQQSGNSCMLYLASVMLDELGSLSSDCLELLVCGSFIDDVLVLLSNPESYRKNPDMAEDFYRFCKRLVQRRPDRFLHSLQARRIFELAVNNCDFEHPDTLPSLFDFLTALCTSEIKFNQGIMQPMLTDPNNFKAIIAKMLAVVAKDELLSETKSTYSDFLANMFDIMDKNIVIKSIEEALVEIVHIQSNNANTRDQVTRLLSDLTGRLQTETDNNSKSNIFRRFIFELPDAFF